MSRFAVIVPPVPALLRGYAGSRDPLPDLRQAAREAVTWLAKHSPARIVVLGDGPEPANLTRGVSESLTRRVADELLDQVGFTGTVTETLDATDHDAGVLVLANGTARRGEKAPGHLDDRASRYDALIEQALAVGDRATLRGLDADLGRQLMASGITALNELSTTVGELVHATMVYADDPFGVQYWVVTWECSS